VFSSRLDDAGQFHFQYAVMMEILHSFIHLRGRFFVQNLS